MDNFNEALSRFKKDWTGDNSKGENICPICGGLKWVYHKKENGSTYVTRCECQEKENAIIRLKRSGISEEFRKKGFKNYDDKGLETLKAAKNTAIRYCQKFPEIKNTRHNSILFMGQVGSGKTHLSMAICNAIMDTYRTGVIYMPYRDEITNIKQSMGDEENYNRAMNQFKKAHVLMIDDMLKGKITEADNNILFEIVNHRYMNNMPMIISTEKTENELLEFDEATMSRVLEMSSGYQVKIVGREYNYRI